MIVWVLIAHIMVSGAGGVKTLPYFAFNNQSDCEGARGNLPSNAKADCVAFGADYAAGKQD